MFDVSEDHIVTLSLKVYRIMGLGLELDHIYSPSSGAFQSSSTFVFPQMNSSGEEGWMR